MARQRITSKKPVSRSRDEDVKSDRKPVPPPESDTNKADESTDHDEENSGVDDEGLEKLMKALGEDGLDEFDLAQLRMLSGTAVSEDDANAESVSEDEEPGGGAEEEEEEEGEEIALDDDDVDSVDQDAIPRRKVQVDNKVCLFSLFTCQLGLFYG
jgi:rRNA-processing protein EBP2